MHNKKSLAEVKQFIRDTLPTFDVDFDSCEETSYYQEMLYQDYAIIVQTYFDRNYDRDFPLDIEQEGPWSGVELKRAMEGVLDLPDSMPDAVFTLIAD
jgi:hypothetical protein